MKFLAGLCVLLVCQLAGEILVRLLLWPFPGPVLGMLILLAILMLRRTPGAAIEQASGALLSHLSLLFVPAGVGIMALHQRIAGQWWPILVSILLSTALTIAVTAWVMHALIRHRADSGADNA